MKKGKNSLKRIISQTCMFAKLKPLIVIVVRTILSFPHSLSLLIGLARNSKPKIRHKKISAAFRQSYIFKRQNVEYEIKCICIHSIMLWYPL